MSIINAHCHLIQAEKVLNGRDTSSIDYLKNIPAFEDADLVLEMLSLKNLMAQMDEAGIQTSVLYAMYAPLLYSANEFVAQTCLDHPDRFIGFASVDFEKENHAEQLRHAVEDLGMKGLKLHPPLQKFYPNDKSVWPLYAMAQELEIPVVFHVGTTPFGCMARLDQADPLLIDDIANDFPRLKIMLTHLGTLWHNESFMIVEKHPNLYIDTAAYPYEIEELLTERTIRRIGPSKFIFGTDFPMPYEGRLHRLGDFVEVIDSLAISNELKTMIFSENFKQMLN